MKIKKINIEKGRNYEKYLPFYTRRQVFVAFLKEKFNLQQSTAERRHRELVWYLKNKEQIDIIKNKKHNAKVKIIKIKKPEIIKVKPIKIQKIEAVDIKQSKTKEVLVQSKAYFTPDMLEEPALAKKLLFQDMIKYKMKITPDMLKRNGFNQMNVNWMLKEGLLKEWKIVKETEEDGSSMTRIVV
jgi:hypothetical protein